MKLPLGPPSGRPLPVWLGREKEPLKAGTEPVGNEPPENDPVWAGNDPVKEPEGRPPPPPIEAGGLS